MTPRDLPETARPWTDPLGNVWCVTLESDGVSGRLHRMTDERWREVGIPTYLPFFHPDLLAGLGRTLPPVPSRKRVAKAVRYKDDEGDTCLFAALGSSIADLRWKVVDGAWIRVRGRHMYEMLSNSAAVAAAHEAFQHAGSYLPGEEPE